MNLDDIKKIYFVGIGGIAMSAAAGIAGQRGFEVTGSDAAGIYPPAKDALDALDIPYFTGYSPEHPKRAGADLFILSAGEGPENPEVGYILENGLPRSGFPELLYELAKDRLRLVVAGTHGKSTTTGLLGHLLKNLDDSSFLAGGVLQNYDSNFYLGDGNYFVFEGDEYKSEFDDPTPKFQYYRADISVLTNLEYDHPDMFENFEVLRQEFRLLVEKMPEDGLVVYNADDAALTQLVHESNVSSVSFGIDNPADFKAEDINYSSDFTTIEIINKFSKAISSKLLGQTEQYKIQLPGKINVYNSLAAIATLRSLGFAREQIALDLLTYRGIKRRFEVVGVKNGITIIDDYAHHPTAVKETLEAARLRYFPQTSGIKHQTSKLWAIFEPHTFSRTKATLDDLAKSFDAADEVLISEIYPAREKASAGTVTSSQVVNAVTRSVGAALARPLPDDGRPRPAPAIRLVSDKTQALTILKSEAKPGDVIIIMAVGSFNRLAYELKEIL